MHRYHPFVLLINNQGRSGVFPQRSLSLVAVFISDTIIFRLSRIIYHRRVNQLLTGLWVFFIYNNLYTVHLINISFLYSTLVTCEFGFLRTKEKTMTKSISKKILVVFRYIPNKLIFHRILHVLPRMLSQTNILILITKLVMDFH